MENKDYWYDTVTEYSDVIMSSRVRLARNINNFNFLNRLNSKEKQKIINEVKDVLENINFGKDKNLNFINIEKISTLESLSMAEKHLISYDMALNPKDRAVFLSNDKNVSIMINEEDHLRLQFFSSNFDIHDMYSQAQKFDTVIDERLKYAFDEELGYLTECLTNIGTGMRASVLLHLPALERCGAISKISNTLSKMGLTIRGTFGEGSKVKGSFYQVSNQITIGISETNVIDNLKSVVNQIISQERATRKSLIKSDINFQDTLMRAFGIIKYAKIINYEEFIELASLVRIAISEKLISETDLKTINYLINNLGAATISYNNGGEIPPLKRDIIRAEIIKNKLSNR